MATATNETTISDSPGKTCCICGTELPPDEHARQADGQSYCESCYDEKLLTDPGGSEAAAAADEPRTDEEEKEAPVETEQPASVAQDGAISVSAPISEPVTLVPMPDAPVPAAGPVSVAARPTEGAQRRAEGGVLSRITCPHCWERFGPDQVLWVSEHAELLGDQVLGPEAASRFLPTRFAVEGHAIDARGMACHNMACPHCHLIVPRAVVEIDPLFVSIIGVPASGKSYLLTAMSWELRRILPVEFAVAFNDADTLSNRNLNEYEETLFFQSDPDRLVAIRKTETEGELYDQIHIGQQVISLPKPILFAMRPVERHPNAARAEQIGRLLCFYDNAGEHFQPGRDTVSAPVTQHLARSQVLMFLYDPTQDPRFRDRCRRFSADPQLGPGTRIQRQETILTEAALRVRRYAGLGPSKKHDRPLLVVVSKSDAWAPLLDVDISSEPIVPGTWGDGDIGAVDVPRIEDVSRRLRQLLLRYAPELVATAEDFCQHVVYIPVSALGHSPEVQANSGMLGIRPKDIQPHWITAPILYTFAKWTTGMLSSAERRVLSAESNDAGNSSLITQHSALEQ